MSRNGDLHGKVAVVVGGGRGRGAAFAENIASRGATTVISYRGDDEAAQRTLALLEWHGVTAEASRSDAAEGADAARLFDGVLARHGQLDIVVHALATASAGPLAGAADEDFDRLVAGSVRAAFHTLRAATRHLGASGRCVVLTNAPADTGSPVLGSAARAAVEQLALAAAAELGARGATVNIVDCRRRPADISPAVAWLVSPAAGWFSGRTVPADGALL